MLMTYVAALLLRTVRNACLRSTRRSRLECRLSEQLPSRTSCRTEFPRPLQTWHVLVSRSGSWLVTSKVPLHEIRFLLYCLSVYYFSFVKFESEILQAKNDWIPSDGKSCCIFICALILFRNLIVFYHFINLIFYLIYFLFIYLSASVSNKLLCMNQESVICKHCFNGFCHAMLCISAA